MWPGRPAARVEDGGGLAADLGGRGEQRDGIEIALDGAVVPIALQAASRSMRQSTPMTSPPASRMRGEQAAGAGAEVDHRHAGADARERRARVRQHEGAVVVGRQTADPAVEELHRLGAGGDLAAQVAR